MKALIKITTVLILLVQTMSFAQTKDAEITSETKETESQIDTKNLKKFVGKYIMEEANFELEIVQEEGKMYIITVFSKDPLVLKNETTITEPSRGVDLELITDNKNGLKYSQNGYETILKRITPKTKS